MKYKIIITCTKGQDSGRKWKFSLTEKSTIVIGRLPGCHVLLKDSKVSQSHCLVQIQKNEICLLDMGSTTGTKVNKKKITSLYHLQDDDIISIGRSTLKVHVKSKKKTSFEEFSIKTQKETKEKSGELPKYDYLIFENKDKQPKNTEVIFEKEVEEIKQSPKCHFCLSENKLEVVNEWYYCACCSKFMDFLLKEMAITPYKKTAFSEDFIPGKVESFLQTSYYEPPNTLSKYGITFPVLKNNTKCLLYISRNEFSQASLTLLEQTHDLKSKNIEYIYPLLDSVFKKDHFFVLMPYFPQSISNPQKLSSQKILAFFIDISKSLEYATRYFGSHGEIYPENLYFEITGTVYLMGYGLLRQAIFPKDKVVDMFNLHQLKFFAPERISGKQLPDEFSDMFSIGALLFYFLTGEYVYKAESIDELQKEIFHYQADLEKIENTYIKNFLEVVLHEKPEERYPSLNHMIDILSMMVCL